MKFSIFVSIIFVFFPMFLDVEFIQTRETETAIEGISMVRIYGIVVNVSEVKKTKPTGKDGVNYTAIISHKKKQTTKSELQEKKANKQKQDVRQNRRLRKALEWMNERGKLTTSSIKLEL